ncbi:MAG: DUF1326 domain-containing protein [Fuerstiella sp.]|nr:DUF1326 domain-containing protein [Fuerstiella sp.]
MKAAILSSIFFVAVSPHVYGTDSVSGHYVEVRTCQVYTGPCFANGEVGSAGKNAMMTWHITRGRLGRVDLAGQSVSVIVKTSHTLGFNGLNDAKSKKAIVIIDSAANDAKADALKNFVLSQTGLSVEDVTAVRRKNIAMQFDIVRLTATVEVTDMAKLETRPARKGDCICSNESAYYPPLVSLKGFVPGVTIEGEVAARGLGTRWSIPDSRTAYMGTFDITTAELALTESL